MTNDPTPTPVKKPIQKVILDWFTGFFTAGFSWIKIALLSAAIVGAFGGGYWSATSMCETKMTNALSTAAEAAATAQAKRDKDQYNAGVKEGQDRQKRDDATNVKVKTVTKYIHDHVANDPKCHVTADVIKAINGISNDKPAVPATKPTPAKTLLQRINPFS